ncbi:MAG: AAA family ATPase [Puniceicoccales bacterium]|jgi:BioD-like phosphotransacetylase family protein|nr:AAA family ATPase [Puniceicoccales bacterium]
MPTPPADPPRFAEDIPGLLTHPLNTTTPRVFVAATRMNDGKTTTCLGLYGALHAMGLNVGYIKPIAQRLTEVEGQAVDEDTKLVNTIYKVNIPIAAMSPVAIDPTFTRRYLDAPDEAHPLLVDRISRAFDRAAYQKDIIIIEGSGHAGVGAVIDSSNAHNAQLLRSKCIIVAGGGIGRPVDEIAINKALFDKMGVECVGVILNKVLRDKIDFVREYATKGLARLGVPLLGVLPLCSNLAKPNLTQIVEEVEGFWLHRPARQPSDRIQKVIMGAMSANSISEYLGPGVLFIMPGDREDLLFSIIASVGVHGDQVASGIILTNNLRPHPRLLEMLRQTNIPVVAADAEGFAVTIKINNMTVKTQPEDSDKIPVIENLIRENVDLDALLKAVR